MKDAPTPTPLAGIPIRVSPHLTGCKFAVQLGDGPIVVSPAMYDLITHASPEELQTLLENIPLRRLPAVPSFRELAQVPFITRPEPDPFAREIRMRFFRE